jgi:Fe-S oxidoreductase
VTDLPVLPATTVDAATLGGYCPKLCTFACPVHAATGREDAVPWGFHRAVTDLAERRRAPDDVADDLVACTGCLACRTPCAFDQDVPDQVRHARAVAVPSTAASERALDHLAAGRRPDGTAGTDRGPAPAGATVLHAGCQDPEEVVAAARALLAAAGHDVTVVDDGCCGQLARDLGAPGTADGRHAHRQGQLSAAARVVVLDPHCRPALPDDVEVVDLWTVLADADLPLATEPTTRGTYHDPCLLARGAGVTTAPRVLLAAAGVEVVEPEHHGADTACAGAGMGLPRLDPTAADATAARRSTQLAAAAADVTVTACSRAADRLRAAGHPTHDLAVLLAARLTEAP